jgi:ACS family glucarate transporter-like MFS transporter
MKEGSQVSLIPHPSSLILHPIFFFPWLHPKAPGLKVSPLPSLPLLDSPGMNRLVVSIEKPTRVRFGVLAFACVLSMITYLDRVCMGTVATNIQGEFGLSESQKGWLFTAFAFAYAIFEIPSGWLGDRYGARKTLIRIVLWWSLFTALTGSIYPTPGSLLGFSLLIIVRLLFGMGEAGAYPNIARAFHNWFPFSERGSVKGTVWMAGRFAGGMTAFIVYALMFYTVVPDSAPQYVERNQHLILGSVGASALDPWSAVTALGATTSAMTITHWRHIFHIFGAIGVLWCIAWWWWYRDDPAKKTGVNAAEVALIQGDEHRKGKLVVPWMKLITSTNLWLLCAMYFLSSYGWYLNITYWPGYLKEQLHIEPGSEKWTWKFWEAGLMAGLPLLAGAVGCLIGGLLTDWFIRKTGDRKWGRRLFGVIGHGLTAICFFLAMFFLNNPRIFTLLIAMAAFWNDLTMGSSWASCLDIGKRYSGIVAGCMNTVGNLGGALAGISTGLILDFFTGSLQRGSPQYEVAKYHGWNLNIFLFGMAFLVAVFCWLKFDATKPVAD